MPRVASSTIFALFLTVTAVSAQAFEVRPAAGVAWPIGEPGGEGSAAHTGPGVTLNLRLQPAKSALGVEAGVVYAWLDDDVDRNVDQGSIHTGIVLRQPPVRASARLWPYGVAGVGLYAGDCRCSDGSFVGWGVYGGGGTDFQVGTVPLFVEVRFHRVFSDAPEDVWLVPVMVGLRL